jgi:hypothetical protein
MSLVPDTLLTATATMAVLMPLQGHRMPAPAAVSPSTTMVWAITVAHLPGAHVLGQGLERDLHGCPPHWRA